MGAEIFDEHMIKCLVCLVYIVFVVCCVVCVCVCIVCVVCVVCVCVVCCERCECDVCVRVLCVVCVVGREGCGAGVGVDFSTQHLQHKTHSTIFIIFHQKSQPQGLLTNSSARLPTS